VLDEKKMAVAFFIFYFITVYFSCAKAENHTLSIGARAFVLMDATTGRILLEKNSKDKMAMASTTKIMTALVALENGDLYSQVKVSPKAASVGGSSFYLKPSEILSLENMLYGLLLPSGNDAAVAIAEHIGGSEENFVKMMNQKALELGALNTHFANPHGLDNPDHYTTAEDLAIIAKHAWTYNKFREIVQTKTKEIKDGNVNRKIFSTNRLLWEFDGADGIKTGYTGNAGKCLVATADKKGFRLISVVLGSADHFQDSKRLLDYGFANYKLTPIVIQNNYFTTISVEKGVLKTVDLIAEDSIFLPIKDNEKVSCKIIAPKKIKAPVFKGEKIGQLHIYIDNKFATSISLVASRDIRQINFQDMFNKLLRFWTTKWEMNG